MFWIKSDDLFHFYMNLFRTHWYWISWHLYWETLTIDLLNILLKRSKKDGVVLS